MTCRAAVAAAACTLLLSAVPARAQKDQFAAAVRDLAGAALAADPAARTAGITVAAERMAAALAQWDRTINAIDTRVTRDLQNASASRAYELHFELAVLYLERGRIPDALRHLEHASNADPHAAESPLLHATALDRSGKTDAAGQRWLAVWLADRDNPAKAYRMLRAGGGTESDRTAAAGVIKRAYERLLAEAEPPRSLFGSVLNVIPDTFSTTPIVGDAATAGAFALIAEARYDDALAALRRDAPPGDGALAHFTRGREHEQANRVREARQEYEAAVAGTLAGRSLLYVGIGRLAQVEGDFAGAVDAFTRAVRLNPNDVNMHRELGLAYAAQGAVDEAFVELAASLLLNPRDAQTFADIGRLFLDAGRDAEALPPLYRALALAPERYETRYAIATGLTRIGRGDDAARELAAFQQAQRDALDRQRKGFDTPPR